MTPLPKKPDHWVVRMNYRNRTGFGLLGFCVLSVHLTRQHYGPLAWGLLVLMFLLYPHGVYWRAKRASQPLPAEINNLLIDNLMFGGWIAMLGFPLWISYLLGIVGAINLAAFRGMRGLPQALGALAAGALIGVAIGGLRFQPETDLLTSLLSMASLTFYLLMFAYGAHTRTLKLHDTREKLRHSEQALQQQLTEINALQTQLREQANRDPLTGLYNRRYLDSTMARELSRCQREALPLSLLLIDLDHFKRINDSYGHPAGDAILKQLAQLLAQQARAGDVVCRYGGEEFLLLLPNMPLAAAQERAEHFRALLAATQVRCGEHDIRATLSIGVASAPVHGHSAADLIKAADHALYRAKTEGRNRVMAFDPADTTPSTPVHA